MKPGLEVHALDFSLPFLREARQEAEGVGVDLTLVHADLRALPYEDESFHGVVSGGTLNELTDLPRDVIGAGSSAPPRWEDVADVPYQGRARGSGGWRRGR